MDETLVNFGKHAELTFQELAETQPEYIDWLLKQEGIDENRPELYDYLVFNGFGSTVSTYTDHNTFQAQFTNFENIYELLNEEAEVYNLYFEDECNADIVVEYYINKSGWIFNYKERHVLLIELKPTVSNDYPEILRQMRKQCRAYRFYHKDFPLENIHQMLICQSYTGKIPLGQVKIIYGKIEFNELDDI